ncbi:exopolyphosphatase PRUNE1-like [Diadema antillarum]|uniref:exopolyphosphatase PRUNE1-like n=1 Tax=Diadema antillarum TaxID=105358 RepID=UPI003A8C4A51
MLGVRDPPPPSTAMNVSQDFSVSTKSISQTDWVHLVIGNEACDLDSTVSAITYAYHLSQKPHRGDEEVRTYIPVLNVPRSELPLRTEVTHLLPECGVCLENLVCRDEVALESLPNLSVTLVDHNVTVRRDAWLDSHVVEVIDHRPNARHDDGSRTISITLEMVGSCSTLVARILLEEQAAILDPNLIKLLLGTILLDNVNMSEAAGKKTATDVDVADKLEALCPSIDRQRLFGSVQAAKFDISVVNGNGISAVTWLLVAVTRGMPFLHYNGVITA